MVTFAPNAMIILGQVRSILFNLGTFSSGECSLQQFCVEPSYEFSWDIF